MNWHSHHRSYFGRRKWTANAGVSISPPHPLKMDEVGRQDRSLRPYTIGRFAPCQCYSNYTLTLQFRPPVNNTEPLPVQRLYQGCFGWPPDVLETKIKATSKRKKTVQKSLKNYPGLTASPRATGSPACRGAHRPHDR